MKLQGFPVGPRTVPHGRPLLLPISRIRPGSVSIQTIAHVALHSRMTTTLMWPHSAPTHQPRFDPQLIPVSPKPGSPPSNTKQPHTRTSGIPGMWTPTPSPTPSTPSPPFRAHESLSGDSRLPFPASSNRPQFSRPPGDRPLRPARSLASDRDRRPIPLGRRLPPLVTPSVPTLSALLTRSSGPIRPQMGQSGRRLGRLPHAGARDV